MPQKTLSPKQKTPDFSAYMCGIDDRPHRLSPPIRIYAMRGDRFWKFAPMQWLKAVDKAARTGTLSLPGAGEPPLEEWTRWFDGARHRYLSRDPRDRIHAVEDWDAHAFRYHAETFRRLYGARLTG